MSGDVFENPLVSRYASEEMARLWSPQRKFSTWRRLWLALAEAEFELGLTKEDGSTPRISEGQLAKLRQHLDDIDFENAKAHEKRLRHDVMAHIHTLGDACPEVRDILHLGATSCFVTDNSELILIREGLVLVRRTLVNVIDKLATFATQWRDLPTVGFTHFQPAQPTTVGKRACLWAQDFVMDLEEIEHRLSTLKFRGAKGTTGTQASFLALFRGDHDKVRKLDELVAQKMGFASSFPVTGQTYPRKLDDQILSALSGVGQSCQKFGNDLRLLAHRREVDEPFEKEQVGSSAMAYKRNPMRSERMCGLGRFLCSLTTNTAQTASVQWLERTLDDSVNRRLVLPQAFLTADALLRLAVNVSSGLVVNEDVVTREYERLTPFLLTENLLMAAVARGHDRQEIHEVIRRHSHSVSDAMKVGASANDLLERLAGEPCMKGVDFERVAADSVLVGRAPQQVEAFVENVVEPIRSAHRDSLGGSEECRV